MTMEQLLNNILFNFILGVAASFLASIIWERYASRLPSFSGEGSTSINGFWIAKVPNEHRDKKEVYNLFRIKKSRGKVLLYIEHYNCAVNFIHKLKGMGFYHSPFMSASYKFTNSIANSSGTLTLRLKQTDKGVTVLNGIYSQLIEIDTEKFSEIIPITENYTLYRFNLPFIRQIRALVNISYYNSLSEVRECYKNATS